MLIFYFSKVIQTFSFFLRVIFLLFCINVFSVEVIFFCKKYFVKLFGCQVFFANHFVFLQKIFFRKLCFRQFFRRSYFVVLQKSCYGGYFVKVLLAKVDFFLQKFIFVNFFFRKLFCKVSLRKLFYESYLAASFLPLVFSDGSYSMFCYNFFFA